MKTKTRSKTKKIAPLDFHVKADGRMIEGYASVFDVLDSHRDVVPKGAFEKTIRERHSRNLVKLLWQHDASKPLGRVTKLAEDDYGLHFEAQIAKTALGDEARELMQIRAVDRMSIGYEATRVTLGTPAELGMDMAFADEVARLDEIKLFEISPVTFASNEDAAILAVKRAGLWMPSRKMLSAGSFVAYVENDVEKVARVESIAMEGEVEHDGETLKASAAEPVIIVEEYADTGDGYEATGRTRVIAGDDLVEIEGVELAPKKSVEVREVKAGRVLSAKNLKRLEDAVALLNAVVDEETARRADAGNEDEEDGNKGAPQGVESTKGVDDDSTPNENEDTLAAFKALSSSLNSLKSTLGSEQPQ